MPAGGICIRYEVQYWSLAAPISDSTGGDRFGLLFFGRKHQDNSSLALNMQKDLNIV